MFVKYRAICTDRNRAGSRMDAQSKEVCCRYDSDATEGIQDEKVGISCDYPIGTTADRQLKHLVVLGIATGSNRLGDLYQLGVPVKPRACAFCVISAMTSWRDSSVLVTSRRRRLRRRSSLRRSWSDAAR